PPLVRFTLFPYTTLFRSGIGIAVAAPDLEASILTIVGSLAVVGIMGGALRRPFMLWFAWTMAIVLSLLLAHKAGVATGSLHLVRSEEHTSELQSPDHLVC